MLDVLPACICDFSAPVLTTSHGSLDPVRYRILFCSWAQGALQVGFVGDCEGFEALHSGEDSGELGCNVLIT